MLGARGRQGGGGQAQPKHRPGHGTPGQIGQPPALRRGRKVVHSLHLHALAHRRRQVHLAKAQIAQQFQLLLERRHQVLGGLPVVVVAATSAGHGDHEFLVEVPAQAVGAGGDASGGPGGTLLHDLRGVDQADIGLAVGQQDHAPQVAGVNVLQRLRARQPPTVKVGGAVGDQGRDRPPQLGPVAHRHRGDEALHLVVELHQRDRIGRSELADDVQGATAGLSQGLTLHGAGPVDDQ